MTTDDPINGDLYAAKENLLRAVAPIAARVMPPAPEQATYLTTEEADEVKRWGNALLHELRQSSRSRTS